MPSGAQREQLPAAVRRTVVGPFPVDASEKVKAVTETLTRRLATVPALDAGAT